MAIPEGVGSLSEHFHRYVTEVVWPFPGMEVEASIRRLQDEGFNRSDAKFWLEALTILQLHRLGYEPGPEFKKVTDEYIKKTYTEAQIDSAVGRGMLFYEYQEEYSEAQIESMIQHDIALPGWEEYEGFEGHR